MSEIDEVVGEFLVESYENLDRYDEDLLALEQDPGDPDALASVFRTIHTIKGTCGFLGFERLEQLAHVTETLLGRLRDGDVAVTPAITSTLLATGDAVRDVLRQIEETGSEPVTDHTGRIAALTQAAEARPEPDASDADGAVADEPVVTPRLGEILIDSGAATKEDVIRAAREQELGDQRPLGQILVDSGAVTEEAVEAALRQQATRPGHAADTTIRVDVGLLDGLMNLVGELVLVRNQIVQLATVSRDVDTAVASAAQRLNLITTELQEGVMKTRMQPIGSVWNKFPRIVRDLAVPFDKRVRVETEGQDTELDKSIIEAIKDPLTHLVRNAVDHGVETPAVREAAGKPLEAVLRLRAYHEGGQVNIEIADDGAGIDTDKVKAKALERGLVTPEQAATMGEREATNLVFLPGFSTAEQVTSVSGRGVGMDVVKTNIERIGGSVDAQTVAGRGTTFKVKIPLTLAIIPALMISTADQRFAIPQVNVVELLRLGADHRGVEYVNGAPVYRLRGKLLPLVDLGAQLRLSGGPRDRAVNIVVLQADAQHFGLVVDEVRDTEEIVVKPLGSHLKGIPTLAGATIMGDGRVALILDVFGLAQGANVVTEGSRPGDTSMLDQHAADAERRRLLIVRSGESGQVAVPLDRVTRLEELAGAGVEQSGPQRVVHYRGRILPLVGLSDALHGAGTPWNDDHLHVLVAAFDGRAAGIVVDRVLDIVDEAIVLEGHTARPGVEGSAVIDDRVTDIVDLDGIVAGGLVNLMMLEDDQ